MKKVHILIFAACLSLATSEAQNMTLSYGPMVGNATSGGDDGVHVVQSGQTLYAIARMYNTTTEEIQRLNNMESTAILVGQKLKVPAKVATKPADNEEPSTTDESSSGERKMPDDGKVMVSRYVYEKVLPGETLATFAKRVGASVEFIKEQNGVNAVKAGEKMIVKEEMVPVAGEKKKTTTPPKKDDAGVRDLGDLDAILGENSDTKEPEAKSDESTASDTENTPASSEVDEKGGDSEVMAEVETPPVQEKEIIEFVNPSMVLGNNIETGTFTQKDAKIKARYYVYHKSLPKGTKVKIHIPDNAGFVMAEVIGSLEEDSPYQIALSPACVRIIGGTVVKKVTFSY